ncbi:MAG TPA: nucleotide exchange factor GrpE [Bacteroidetes bacterium]|nr:heat shock protein GrpE [bacterium BMS3Bbin04]HDO65275.1 nucleotide exchange factor GrpE [Bacteroidota bacterium]HEX04400.1 nucleotide exchange factor GrpE [Bacteroidota bacterium]
MKDKKRNSSEPETDLKEEQSENSGDTVEISIESGALASKQSDLTEENDRLRDQALRARAEFENFRRRRNRELEEYRALANESLIEDLLPVLDDLGLLLNSGEDKNDISSLMDGARLIQQKFLNLLKLRGLEEIEAEGQQFDPEVHEALMETPSEDAEPGTIVSVHQKGYKLGPKLIRPSRVIIVAAKSEEEN